MTDPEAWRKRPKQTSSGTWKFWLGLLAAFLIVGAITKQRDTGNDWQYHRAANEAYNNALNDCTQDADTCKAMAEDAEKRFKRSTGTN